MNRYIKHITIDGLFGMRTFDWELGDVNIIGGRNGIGKSTIIKSCYYLLKFGYLPEEQNLAQLVEGIRLAFTDGVTLIWNRLKESDNTEEISKTHNLYFSTSGSQSTTATDKDGNRINVDHLIKETNAYLINSFEQYISDANRMATEYAATDKDVHVTYLDVLIQNQLNIRNEQFAAASEQLFSSIQQAQTNNEHTINVANQSDVRRYLELYPVIHSFFKEYNVSVNNKMVFERNRVNIPFQSLSMGEKQLLYVLLLVTNASEKPSVVFMDEPDLGMHIEWKERLVKSLRGIAPNVQLVISTHAPSLIKGWKECVSEFSHLTKEING